MHKNMDWIKEAKRLFIADKPEHFTNVEHCEECSEHDETLLRSSIDTIGLEELGNPGWDPICFSSPEGIKYYMPAFVRLSLETIENEFYLGQFLFHLESDGKDNALVKSCSSAQREFVVKLMDYFILTHSKEIDLHGCENEIFRVQEIWENP